VLADWNNSLGVDMSLTLDTLSWFQANPCLLFLLNAACLWTHPDSKPTSLLFLLNAACLQRHAALRRKSKDWLAWNQNSVSKTCSIEEKEQTGWFGIRDTLSWFQANQSLLFLLNAACLVVQANQSLLFLLNAACLVVIPSQPVCSFSTMLHV
jgi:hypothetical protein